MKRASSLQAEATAMQTREKLSRELLRIDGRGYPAYKDLRGAYSFPRFVLYVDHVQGDPYAAPSKLRLRVPLAEARIPASLFANPVRRVAFQDFIARSIRDRLAQQSPRARKEGSGKSGLIQIDVGGQQVIERAAIVVAAQWVEARIEVGLPAAGRRVQGKAAQELLLNALPDAALAGLLWESLPREAAEAFVDCIENQECIRSSLEERGLVAFVGNGAVLPRQSGNSDLPMQGESVVPFVSPPEFEVTLPTPHPVECEGGFENALRGMGIPRGVTLIVGGGYHGKSTLLKALERSVHPHIPGDGREKVIADARVVKIRAEDGRSVEGVDIHSFISNLPGKRDTHSFCSEDASGSTSQASNIVEAIEAGCSGLLLDEDTSATNFMIRDARMQSLIRKENEPITPFLERVHEIYETLGISTLLVMGGCGDYFDVADRVIEMAGFRASDVTQEARRVAARHESERVREVHGALAMPRPRIPDPSSFDASRGRREVKIDARGCEEIVYGRSTIDLRNVEQLVDASQLRAIGHAIHLARERFMIENASLSDLLDEIERELDESGLDVLEPRTRGTDRHPGHFARPRRFEIAAAINRMRTLRMRA